MKKNFGSQHWLFPQPVLMIATYNEDGTPDIMNAAWGGISDSDEISISISSSHKTAENLLKRGAFTVSFATAAQVAACDYVSGIGQQGPGQVRKGRIPRREIRVRRCPTRGGTAYGPGVQGALV